ncbi:MAG: hypothetical protein EBU90_16970 [Proteobacteria bacterium]|nr:hypothetical protein [Pseudomonadota bacterium]
MPTYAFLNKETNELEEHTMRISQYDEFKQNNPHLERYITEAPILSDASRMSVPGTKKADSTFEKYVIDRIKHSVPGNTVKDGHKTTSGNKEW